MDRVLITTLELAARWAVDPDTVRAWRVDGVGPPWLKLNPGRRGAVRYRLEDILEWERRAERLAAQPGEDPASD